MVQRIDTSLLNALIKMADHFLCTEWFHFQ